MSDILTKSKPISARRSPRQSGRTRFPSSKNWPRPRPSRAAFCAAIERRIAAGDYALIAEIKKASPSKGLIRADFDPPSLAKAYEAGGATCLSVLTDAPSFQGKPEFLAAAAQCHGTAGVAQGFHLRAVPGVNHARSAPIASSSSWRRSMSEPRERSKMPPWPGYGRLVEVHDEDELERRSSSKSRLIGINNRDLRTFKTSSTSASVWRQKSHAIVSPSPKAASAPLPTSAPAQRSASRRS